MLQATDLHKHFGGVAALERVSLAVEPGEVVGMAGPNGSGKSTLLEILCGRIRPDGGEVVIDGMKVNLGVANGSDALPVFRTHQRPRVFPWHSVAENIQLGRWGVPGSALDSRTAGGMELSSRLAAGLSLGEKRNLNLAWLWERMDSVRYFLLDEPCAGGDEDYVRELIRFVATARTKGKGVLWVEHNTDMLSSQADRVVALVAGRSQEGAASTVVPSDGSPEKPSQNTTDTGLTGRDLTIERSSTIILKNVSIQVRSGEVVGLLGPNGIGKSTMLLALYGHPDCKVAGGAVLDGGTSLSQAGIQERVNRGIHLLPQEGGVFKSLTVAEFIGCSVETACQQQLTQSKISEILEIVPHLQRIMNRRCGVLSGGERRIAGMARVVALAPRFALLDEPTAGLDREARHSIGMVIRNLASAGIGVLLAEQDRAFASTIADRLVELGEPPKR
jgi:ABC-type branched-subunit amino acid transport system ATPase component